MWPLSRVARDINCHVPIDATDEGVRFTFLRGRWEDSDARIGIWPSRAIICLSKTGAKVRLPRLDLPGIPQHVVRRKGVRDVCSWPASGHGDARPRTDRCAALPSPGSGRIQAPCAAAGARGACRPARPTALRQPAPARPRRGRVRPRSAPGRLDVGQAEGHVDQWR